MGVKKLFDIQGKVALITGGSRGLGLQMAEALGEMGAKLAITARKQGELDEAAAHLGKQGYEVLTIAGDLSRFDTIPGMVDKALAKFGTIDILVNNAGATWGAPAEEYPAEGWHKVINLNAICPGFFPSKMSRGLLEKIEKSVIAATPLGRLGGEEDLKGVIAFLASDASRHVTGQYIAVDGGACIA